MESFKSKSRIENTLSDIKNRIEGLDQDVKDFREIIRLAGTDQDLDQIISISSASTLPAERKSHLEKADVSLERIAEELGVDKATYDPYGEFDSLTPSDICVAFIAGLSGSLASLWLETPLNYLHNVAHGAETTDSWLLKKIVKFLNHPASPMDKVMGLKHRLKFGHDLLNPFEVWDSLAKQYGGNIGAGLYFIKHLATDTLSKEGLPLPGHSLFRNFLNDHLKYEDYQRYFTIKARDMAGAALVSAILAIYHSFMKNTQREASIKSYRHYLVNLFAHSVCLVSGIMLGSLNYGSAFLAGKATVQLVLCDIRVGKRLDEKLEELHRRVLLPQDTGPTLKEMLKAEIESSSVILKTPYLKLARQK
jgi:hypothetical protein